MVDMQGLKFVFLSPGWCNLITLQDADVIEGQYIVVLKHGLMRHLSRIGNGLVLKKLSSVGYVARLGQRELEQVTGLDEVLFVEPDSRVRLSATQPWGLARISNHRASSHNFSYDPQGGKGVGVYVVDSGIDINHPEFEGRARWGTTILESGRQVDNNGHGTHVAGIVGSRTYGMAKACNLIAIKVFNKAGVAANSDIISGINWAIADSQKGGVINMSFTSHFSPALNHATEDAIRHGFVVSVAAGNQNHDACLHSPASAQGALTVAATDMEDSRSKYSNYGLCVTLFAPGDHITSTWPNNKVRSLSGTSMAAPHIAGLAAILLSRSRATPEQITRFITATATANKISHAGLGSPDLLAYYKQ